MRFGQLRGVTLTAAFLSSLMIVQTASADGFDKTIPREVLAQDLNTGQPYFAPPVPWGHYAKDGLFDSYYGKSGHAGLLHSGLFHHGCKNCGGSGSGLGGRGCKSCGGSGCGLGGGQCGHGLFGHGCGLKGNGCGDPGCGSGHGSARRIKDCGLCKNKGCGLCESSIVGAPMYVAASSQTASPQVVATPVTSIQSGDPSTGFLGGQTMLCDSCTGKGCGKCGFGGLLHKGSGSGCDSCGGRGCGKCGLFGHGSNGHGNSGCEGCGGKGCGLCGFGNGGGHSKVKLAGLLHHKKGYIKYFVGAGGPVPLTPGYVPYVVTTRSPRDFLAFPPYTPSEF